MEKSEGEKSTLDLIKQELQAFQRQNKKQLQIYFCASNILVEKLVKILENAKKEENDLKFPVPVCETIPDQRSRLRSQTKSKAKSKSREMSISGSDVNNTDLNIATPSTAHVRSEPLNLECDYGCGKIFSSNYKKLRHHVVHTGQRKFSCSICSKKFTDKSHLPRHLKLHTGQKVKTLERTFKCTHRGCSYAAFHRQNLTRHFAVHTEERPFKCGEVNCNYASKRREDLKRHQLTHKPMPTDANGKSLLKFSCSASNCTYKTRRKGHLKRHLKTHNS